LELIKRQLRKSEGYRETPYLDSVGKLTVGIGRNIDEVPFSEDEINLMFINDVEKAESQAELYPSFEYLSQPRKAVLVRMTFQLGMRGTLKFKRMHAALAVKDYEGAADEMLDSKWASQTPHRARRMAEQMRSGIWVY